MTATQIWLYFSAATIATVGLTLAFRFLRCRQHTERRQLGLALAVMVLLVLLSMLRHGHLALANISFRESARLFAIAVSVLVAWHRVRERQMFQRAQEAAERGTAPKPSPAPPPAHR